MAVAVCALLTAGTLLAIDALVMSPSERGLAAAEAARPAGSLEQGVLASQRAFLSARSLSSPPVVLLGPGRALDGQLLREALGSQVPVVDMTHLGMQPFELLAAVEEVATLDPALVVLEYCCLDTHGPLRVGTQTAPGSVTAVQRLEQLLGPEAARRQRGLLRRLQLSARSSTARWWDLRAAPRPPSPSAEPPGDRRAWLLALPGSPIVGAGTSATAESVTDVSSTTQTGNTAELRAEVATEVGLATEAQRATEAEPATAAESTAEHAAAADDPLARPQQVALCRAVQRGRHAEVQVALLVSAVEALSAAGTPVLLVEGPLHTRTRVLFDRPIRTELLESLAPLVAHDRVSLVTEHQTGPFPPGDFADLLTLDADGRARLAEALARPVRGMLDR
ncbi:MAG: hypothetical protein DRQ55_08840 [Planctomycetota bacterium]|nr:MAG: hypothetical protein DRQ55_08840 [Planctomycetota bacterium]